MCWCGRIRSPSRFTQKENRLFFSSEVKPVSWAVSSLTTLASRYRRTTLLAASFLAVLAAVGIKTVIDLRPVPDTLLPDQKDIRKLQVRDRRGIPLSVTYQNSW